MHPDDALVTFVGPLAHGVSDAIGEPPGKILGNWASGEGCILGNSIGLKGLLACSGRI
jgi:hypothetical protein